MTNGKNILIYGYGNPGRQDDGLGPALVETLGKWLTKKQVEHVTLDSNYQLQVEDVTVIHDKDLVIFVDASMKENIRDVKMEPLEADPHSTFTMHAISPEYILALCRKIYGQHPPSYLLHIRGYEWEINREISKPARHNMEKAGETLREIIHNPDVLDHDNPRTASSEVSGT